MEGFTTLSQFFYTEGGKLFWAVRKHSVYVGDETGCKNANGYLETRLNGLLYQTHRIIWILHNQQDIPEGMEVDHEDGNPLNNNPDNLRLATKGQNAHNKKNYSSNSTGVKGVGWHKGKLRGRIMVCGKQVHVGYFNDLNEASIKMIEARNKLHKEFANHGFNSQEK